MSKFAEYFQKDGASPTLGSADGLLVRRAKGADLAEIAAMIESEGAEGAVEDWEGALRRIQKAAAADEAVIFVATIQDRIAGYAKAGRFVPLEGSPTNVAPAGWYLSGVLVRSPHRRRGIGRRLTEARLKWIAVRADRAYYFANEKNSVSLELHAQLGFVEQTRDFFHPHVTFEGGAGILFACNLKGGGVDGQRQQSPG